MSKEIIFCNLRLTYGAVDISYILYTHLKIPVFTAMLLLFLLC